MSFVITGDTHGMLDIGKTVKYFNEHEGEYSKDDYLIILGDVGAHCGSPSISTVPSAAFSRTDATPFRQVPIA